MEPHDSESGSSRMIRKPSYSQFPLPPGAPPWEHSTSKGKPRRKTMEDGRVSPYTLSVAAEFSLKRAKGQLVAMGETLEYAKSELSPVRNGGVEHPVEERRLYSRRGSLPISPTRNGNGHGQREYSSSGDMLGDMRKLAIDLRTLRESIDPARKVSGSSVSSSRASTPLTSPRSHRFRDGSIETPRTSPRHSRQSSLTPLKTLREEPVIEVQTMRGGVIGQPSAVVRIFRSQSLAQRNGLAPPRTHNRSISDGIRIRQFDYRGREALVPPHVRQEYTPNWPPDDRPDSNMSMVSESSYHTAYQDNNLKVDAILRNRHLSDISDHISDTATIGRPITPAVQVRSIGVNTEDILPAEVVPAQPLRQRPSRAALLSNIRGCQDGILIAKVHSAVDKLAVQLASSSLSPEDEFLLKQKLQAALELLEDA
jgi:hypothetical protein